LILPLTGTFAPTGLCHEVQMGARRHDATFAAIKASKLA